MERGGVVVVGAGLAGLACALRLDAAGVPVAVLEASDAVGGRVRTDVVDGFRVDRGFQLLNPAYPALAAVADLDALRLRPFAAGVAVARGTRRHRLADPRRLPLAALESLLAPVGSPREKAAFLVWALASAHRDPRAVRDGVDEPLGSALDRAGVRGALRRSVVTPFLAGVLGEDDGSTSASFARLVVRSFVRGTPAVPAAGVGALPVQLASRLPLGAVRLGAPVRALRTTAGAGVRLDTPAGEVSADAVVVATDAATAAGLLPGLAVPPARALTTFWHAADAPPAPRSRARLLHVDADRRGPVVNSAVMTAVAPTYGPPGQHLVATTVLGDRGDSATEAEVLRQLWDVYGTESTAWRLVAVHALPRALPAVLPPLRARRPVALGDGLFVAGDHRDTSSQQGALVSGRRAADAVLAALGHPAPSSPGAARAR